MMNHVSLNTADWYYVSGSPFNPIKLEYYHVVTSDHTFPMYPQRNIIACKHCGIKHDVDKLDIWVCKGCGAPL